MKREKRVTVKLFKYEQAQLDWLAAHYGLSGEQLCRKLIEQEHARLVRDPALRRMGWIK